MTEASLTGDAKRYLTSKGIKVWKMADGFTLGIPDLLTLSVGLYTWFEFKFSQDGTPIPRMAQLKQLQLQEMKDIRANGGVALYAGYMKDGNVLMLEVWDPLRIGRDDIYYPDPDMQAPGHGYELLEHIAGGKSAWHK